MARIDTAKPLNPGQLSSELGRVSVRSVFGRYVEADATEDALRAALAAHTADPNWTEPNPTPPPPDEVEEAEARTQLSAIRDKARQVAAGEGTFTAAQVQKILAHLILRSTR